MTIPTLREKKVGPFTVRELQSRKVFQLTKEYPDDPGERAKQMLGLAVFNGAAEPIGVDAVLDLSQAWFNELLDAYAEVAKKLDLGNDGAPTEGNG